MGSDYLTSFGSILGVFAFLQTFLQIALPPELRLAVVKFLYRIFSCFFTHFYFDITEIDGVNTNELYNAVQLYLSSSVSIIGNRLTLTRAINSTGITFGLSNNDRIVDCFNGVSVQWEHIVSERQTQALSWRPFPEEKRRFTLRIKKKDKNLILGSYLDYIMEKSNEIKRKNQDRFLHTNSRNGSLDSSGFPWDSVPFRHPSTFDTLAMDPLKKKELMEDLKDFANGEKFYQKTGRAWKRGYLLYGPPGTGKSSLIAAMANFLGYDIYDLELTEVHNNTELRKLLMKTSPKSIIVIEDIDCSLNLTNRAKTRLNKSIPRNFYNAGDGRNASEEEGSSITLSGLLNFTDGLWSCCGNERIFVFTTNHIDKLDPALLRSGRMDKHIFMNYCSFPALKILLKNYLDYEDLDLDENVMEELEEIIEKAEITPADVSELLIRNRRNGESAVRELLDVLRGKSEKNGVSREKASYNGKEEEEEEEEEQEKRALESDCKKEGMFEEEGQTS